MPSDAQQSNLIRYKEKIRSETGRDIEIRAIQKLGLEGIVACFKLHPSVILVETAVNFKSTNPAWEDTIAHEITHGYLVYKYSYCLWKPKTEICRNKMEYFNILFSMVDDIVVNKIIQDHGFQPFNSVYLQVIEEETKAVHKGKDYYEKFNEDSLLKNIFIVWRYIQVWSCLNYLKLKHYERRLFKKFIKEFQISYKKQYEKADKVKQIILQNNIFLASSHLYAMQEILKQWNLEDLVILGTYNSLFPAQ